MSIAIGVTRNQGSESVTEDRRGEPYVLPFDVRNEEGFLGNVRWRTKGERARYTGILDGFEHDRLPMS